MRRLALIFLLFLLPVVAQAACLDAGYTVVFVNGVFDTKPQAETNEVALQHYLGDLLNNQSVSVKLGYNQTHVGGLADLIETKFPIFDQYDLDTILMQMHTDVTTRKILLVGHSQGATYANKIYEYLTSHGVPAEDVAVYAVATPDSYVAGGGKYANYSLDDTISVVAKMAGFSPLPYNLNFLDFLNSPDVTASTPTQGHSFIDNYLGAFGTRMVADMQGEMVALKSTAGTATDGCFDSPQATLAYKTEAITLAVADPIGSTLGTGLRAAGTAAVVTAKTTAAVIGAVGNALGSVGGVLGLGPKAPASGDTKTSSLSGVDAAGFALIKATFGSSLSLPDLKELNGTNQGGAVALAFQNPPATQNPPPKPVGEVKGAETQKPSPSPNEPLIPPPPPIAGGGISPGFGGGGGAPPPSVVASPQAATVTFTFTAYDANGVSTICSFDNTPPVSCDHSFSQTLSPGPHMFKVTATDIVGNQTTQTKDFTLP
jgi:hypothetical protein